jgi:hypothetical protein
MQTAICFFSLKEVYTPEIKAEFGKTLVFDKYGESYPNFGLYNRIRVIIKGLSGKDHVQRVFYSSDITVTGKDTSYETTENIPIGAVAYDKINLIRYSTTDKLVTPFWLTEDPSVILLQLNSFKVFEDLGKAGQV